jgi:DNA polymerase-3 subunit delta
LIYLFHGEDIYSSYWALRDLYPAIGPAEVWETGINHIEGSSFDPDKFATIAMVLPFLAKRRLVIVHDLLASSEKSQSSRSRRKGANLSGKQPLAQLLTMLTNLPPTTDVVFIDGRLTKSNFLLGKIQDLGHSFVKSKEFRALRGGELASWIRDKVTDTGGRIQNAAVAALVDTIGGNLWAMSNELEKLLLSDPDGIIEVSDVHALSSNTKESTIFEVVDAIMEERPAAAIKGMQSLLEGGTSATYLLSMIARQARLVVLAQTLLRDRLPQSELAERLGIQPEFVLRKTLDQARKSTPEALRMLYRLILDADVSIKTGRTSDETALTELMALATSISNRPHQR